MSGASLPPPPSPPPPPPPHGALADATHTREHMHAITPTPYTHTVIAFHLKQFSRATNAENLGRTVMSLQARDDARLAKYGRARSSVFLRLFLLLFF